jgi:hypothetical protein
MISPSQGHYLTQTQNKQKLTSMPRVGFEPTIPAFERAKTVHALDLAATVIGCEGVYTYSYLCEKPRDENFSHADMGAALYNTKMIIKQFNTTQNNVYFRVLHFIA